MRYVFPLFLFTLLAGSASAQDCLSGATPTAGQTCTIESDGMTIITPARPMAQTQRAGNDSVQVPIRLFPEEVLYVQNGQEYHAAGYFYEWEHAAGAAFYHVDGHYPDGPHVYDISLANAQSFGPRSTFPREIQATPGHLVYFSVIVSTPLPTSEPARSDAIRANREFVRESTRPDMHPWTMYASGFDAFEAEVAFSRDTVAVGDTFEAYVITRHRRKGTIDDVRPTAPPTFTGGGTVTIDAGPVPAMLASVPQAEADTLVYTLTAETEGPVTGQAVLRGMYSRYYPDEIMSRSTCGEPGRSACRVLEISGTGIIVTVDGDKADSDLTDGVCDTDPDEPGLQCTLRAALEAVEAEGSGTIRFDIPGEGTPRIVLDYPLESSVPVVIDGTSQPGNIEIDGGVHIVELGLTLGGDGSAVRGLSFLRTALVVEGRRVTVTGNRFGATWAGDGIPEAALISGPAIDVRGALAQIGTAASSNDFVWVEIGIDIKGDSAQVVRNQIYGNARPIGPFEEGIIIRANAATVDGNKIQFAKGTGILLTSSARRATVTGNFVRFGEGDGIHVESGASAVIGSDAIEAGNTIEGNGGVGISVGGSSARRPERSETSDIQIVGNLTQRNVGGGVRVFNVSDVQIGGPTETPGLGLGNHVLNGVSLVFATRAVLQGNLITDERATPDWPLYVPSDDVQVGGLADGEANTFVGSESVTEAKLSTILVQGDRVVIEGNTVRNGYSGISLDGLAALIRGNEITFHTHYGIVVNRAEAAIGGVRDGAECDGPCNAITGNGAAGIWVTSAGTGAQILGNYIGREKNESALGNRHGLLVSGADVQIGAPGGALSGTCEGACNVIGANDGYGIVGGFLKKETFVSGLNSGSGPTGLQIQNNVIGATDDLNAPNGVGGVLLGAGTTNAVVGGSIGEADGTRGNLMIGNGSVGVRVTSEGGASLGNTIRDNHITGRGVPIDLVPTNRGADGSTPNDPGDTDDGPNEMLNWPTLVQGRLARAGEAELLTWWSGSEAGSYRIDVYGNPGCRGWMADATQRLSSATVTFPRADAALDTLRMRVPYGPDLASYGALITDENGNTSEVGNCVSASSTGETQWMTLVPGDLQEGLSLVVTLRAETGRVTGDGERAFAVTRDDLEAATDTMFTGGVAGIDGGPATQPGARVGPSWRLSSTEILPTETVDVCLPLPTSNPALVVWRSGATTGHWDPVETVTQTIGGTRHACSSASMPLGDVALAALGGLATPEAPGPEAPSRLVLLPPHPNPTHGDFRLTLGLDVAGPALVQVYDVRGRAVVRVLDDSLPTGWHDLSVQTSSLAPGVYILRVDAGADIVTRTFTVVR